jgi:hypothetical protein
VPPPARGGILKVEGGIRRVASTEVVSCAARALGVFE